MYILITAILILYLILCIKKSRWALFLIPLLLPSYLIRFKIGFVPFTFIEALIIIFFIVWLFKKIRARSLIKYLKSLKCNIFILPAGILLVAATISIFVSADFISALGIWKAYFIIPVIFYLILVDKVKKKKDFKLIIAALGISATAISLYAIMQFITGWGIPVTYSFEGLRRATSIYQYPAALGLYVAPILISILGIYILNWSQPPKGQFFKSNVLPIIAALLMILALVFSRAEGAWIGTIVAVFFIMMFTKHRIKIIVLGALLLSVGLIIPSAREYLISLITFQDVSGDVRLAIWQGTWHLIKNHPIFGAGLAGFQSLYPLYKEAKHTEISLYPHNMFLNFWVETGILGLIALMILIYQYVKNGLAGLRRKISKAQVTRYKIALLAVMICILIYGLVDVPYFKNDLSILFWIWLGLMSVVNVLDYGNDGKFENGKISKQLY